MICVFRKKMLLSPDECVINEKTSKSAEQPESQPKEERTWSLKTLHAVTKLWRRLIMRMKLYILKVDRCR